MNTSINWRPLALAGSLVLALAIGFFIARQMYSVSGTQPQASVTAATTETGELKLDASYLEFAGIKTEPVTAGNLSVDIIASATVESAPNGEAVVMAHSSGTIVRLTKQLGDPVRAGETLAIVESREAAGMAADRSVAESKAALARSAAAREKELYDQRVTPRQDLERAQAELAVAEAEVRRAREAAAASHITRDGKIALVSPLTGRITSTTAALGTFVQPDTELFRVADPKFVLVEAAVTASDANRVTIGDQAKITTASGATFPATVRSVTPTLSTQTRAATVVLSLAGDHEPLSPGQVVQALISPKNTSPIGVVVPEESVQNVGGRSVVFVRTPGGFKVQPIVIASRGAGRVSVTSGLNEGDSIATTNAFFLKAELGKGAGDE